MFDYIYDFINNYVFYNIHDFLEWSCDVYQRTRQTNIFGITPDEDRLEDY